MVNGRMWGKESDEVGKAPVERLTSSSIDSVMSGFVSIYRPRRAESSEFTYSSPRESQDIENNTESFSLSQRETELRYNPDFSEQRCDLVT